MQGGQLSVLVTGAGAPGIRGTIYALQRNPDGTKIRTIGTDVKADVVGRYFVDVFYQVPPPESADYVERLQAICVREAVDVVIPQTTREIAVLSKHKADFEQIGARVMVAGAEAIELANNKARVLQVFAELGLPHPSYRVIHSADDLIDAASSLGYPYQPVVVKPPVSNGMRGFRILREGAWDARRFMEEKPRGVEISLSELIGILGRGSWPELLVTEFLPGPEYSVDVFRGRHLQVAVPRLRRVIRDGISFETELDYRNDVIEYALAAAQRLGLIYAFGFQFKLDGGGVAKVLECNPRVQGTMVASLFGGVNIIWLAVKEVLGKPPTALASELRPATFYRYWGGVGVTEEGAYEI